MAGTNQIEPNSQLKDELYYHGKDVFVKEANILLEFQRESHIVNVRDFFEQNGTAYLVMEYVQGVTLSRYMREQNKPLSIALANQMVQEIGDRCIVYIRKIFCTETSVRTILCMTIKGK